MNREYYKSYSAQVRRQMELLVFGHAGKAVLLFPTRMARFYDYENWGIIGALKDRIERGELQVFCVDSLDADSFYNQQLPPSQRIRQYIRYEQYILQEVLPFMKDKNQGNFLEVAGCSMGAYHAANMAFKHPEQFSKVLCMSGRFDLTEAIQTFRDLFDGFRNEDIYFNMPRQFLPNLEDECILSTLRQLEIIIAIGEQDPFLQDNREFSRILSRKEIPHHLYIWKGYAHRPYYWQQMARLYL